MSDLRTKGYIVSTASTGKAALDLLSRLDPSLVVLNLASSRSSGKRVFLSLQARLEVRPILLLHHKSQQKAEGIPPNLQLVLPFTVRKLENRIRALLPAKDEKIISLGQLSFYPECNLVQVGNNEPRKLTPHLAALLKALMGHPNEVLDRHDLFRLVWQTNYVGDTRTLDVHISWLRMLIEDCPSRPERLRTIRGVGYLLSSE